jgi:uncharacterized membrane protein
MDTVLGPVIHPAYCAILYRRFSYVGIVRSRVWIRWFDTAPALMPFATVALAVGQPY